MAGYSGTPLPKKLGIKPDHAVALVNAPPGFPALLGELPEGVTLTDGLGGPVPFDVILFFTKSHDELRQRMPEAAARLQPAGGLWISWPKKTSKLATNLSENDIRQIGLDAGLVDNKVCAVDETWSGLRFVFRLKDRPARS
jgi:hypothetical protein